MLRSIAVLGFLLMLFGGTAQAKLCELDEVSLNVTPELLGGVGYEPDSEFLSYVTFNRLKVRFGSIETRELKIDRWGNTSPTRVVSIFVDLYGSVRSARDEFISRLEQHASELVKISESGGYMRILSSSTIGYAATVTVDKYEDVVEIISNPVFGIFGWILRKTVRKSLVHLGTARIPVRLDVVMSLTEAGDDVKMETTLRQGASDVDAPWLAAVSFVLPLGGLFATQIEDALERAVDRGATRVASKIEKALPGAGSMSEMFPSSGSTFISIMKELKFAEATGFEGKNPGAVHSDKDSEVEVRLSKATSLDESTSFISEKSACQLVHELEMWKIWLKAIENTGT